MGSFPRNVRQTRCRPIMDFLLGKHKCPQPLSVFTQGRSGGGVGGDREKERFPIGEATSVSSWEKHILKFSSICAAENYGNKYSPSQRAFMYYHPV